MEFAKSFIKKHRLTLIGLVVGAVAGYMYWMLIGCTTGDCPITSSPVYSTFWGILIGGLIMNAFEKEEETKE